MYLLSVWVLALGLLAPFAAWAAPFAALVMDARNGQIIYQDNADTRLYPASLTKMLTLYITFDALRRGEVTLDTPITVTAHAAGQAPSRLGLRAGQVIALRYLIRAAAVKSANDAAAAIGDYLGGNEAGFAARMNATAKALGMTNSTFKNANGLTRPGHMSTAHDMAILARHLIYDFPEYYNIFSRTETDAGVATVYSTNRKFLEEYQGADGIKTGFTVPSGFNLVASAVRGDKRVIGVIFGGTSTAERNKKMEQLLDMGFARVAENVPLRRPVPPDLRGIVKGPPADALVAQNQVDDSGDPNGRPSTGKTVRVTTAVTASIRPQARPDALAVADASATQPGDSVAGTAPAPRPVDPAATAEVASADPEASPVVPMPRPTFATNADAVADNDGEALDSSEVAVAATGPVGNVEATAATPEAAAAPPTEPKPRPEIVFASVAPAAKEDEATAAPEVISRLSTSGGHDWAITLGRYNSRDAAEKALLRTALAEPTVLDQALRKVIDRKSGFDANFVGLTHRQADLACARLQARTLACFALAP